MSTINEVVPLARLRRMHIVMSKWDQSPQEEGLREAAAPFAQDPRKLLVIEQ